MSYFINANGGLESGPAPEGCTACEEGDATYTAALAALQAGGATAQQQAQAQAQLDKSDVTYLRAQEDGLAWPADWASYRAALRTVVKSGGALPVLPATYPDGTPT